MDEKWNRYPEKEPTKDGKYLVCRISKAGNAQYRDIVFWGNLVNGKPLKRAIWYVINPYYGEYEIDNVYAWIPLPDLLPI